MATKRSLQQAEANKKHAMRISLKFNRETDKEIVDFLERHSSRQAVVRDALLTYISLSERGEVDDVWRIWTEQSTKK